MERVVSGCGRDNVTSQIFCFILVTFLLSDTYEKHESWPTVNTFINLLLKICFGYLLCIYMAAILGIEKSFVHGEKWCLCVLCICL